MGLTETRHIGRIAIDPRDPNHLILGSDGGLAVSWDSGVTWDV